MSNKREYGEPWRVVDVSVDPCLLLDADDQAPTCRTTNRLRIAACVNFAAGVPTSALEAAGTGGLEELIDTLRGYLVAQDEVTNARTELLLIDAVKREVDLCSKLNDLLAKLEAK